MGSESEESKMTTYIPTFEVPSLDNYPYNIYAGCVTGFLKGCNISNRSHHNLISLQNVSQSHEIKCMCWSDEEESGILTGRRDNVVVRYSFTDRQTSQVPLDLPSETGVMRSIRCYNNIVIAAFSNGLVKCQSFESLANSTLRSDEVVNFDDLDIQAGQDLFCMDHNRNLPSFILSGGKENPLKLWDLTSPDQPTFIAKNVRNDWLNLRVPVWVTKAEFYPSSNKVVTGTAKAHIRLYDPSSSKRRPIIDIDSKEPSPITALAIKPSSDLQIVAGTGKGTVFLADLRMQKVVKNYKGVKGGVTDIKFHPHNSIFAVSSVDRHIYCYDSDAPKHTKCSSVYTCSQLNCLLLSSQSQWGLKENEDVPETNTVSKKTSDPDDKSDSEEEADEKLWDSMSVVKTKRKSSNLSTPKSKSKKKK